MPPAAVSGLLSSCADVRFLVTSRVALRIGGERLYPVSPMSREEAVELFAERARRVKPELALNGVVGEICDRLDRLPLAIELAAARVRVLTPPAMLARLEQRLPLLTGGARDLPTRQQTLEAAIAWSYELLEPEQQRLFAGSLSSTVGGLGGDRGDLQPGRRARRAHGRRGSVRRLPPQPARRSRRGVRFVMLETIHEYARSPPRGASRRGRDPEAPRPLLPRAGGEGGTELQRAGGGIWRAASRLRSTTSGSRSTGSGNRASPLSSSRWRRSSASSGATGVCSPKAGGDSSKRSRGLRLSRLLGCSGR